MSAGAKRTKKTCSVWVAAVACAAFASGCGTSDDAAAGADAAPGGGEPAELEGELAELLDLMNEERDEVGAPPLEPREDLVCAAQLHSDDIGEAQSCSHEGTDGSSFPERVAECGGSSVRAETIACGAQTPRDVVDGWLNSPPHREAMLDESYREVGLGVHNRYWTAVYDP